MKERTEQSENFLQRRSLYSPKPGNGNGRQRAAQLQQFALSEIQARWCDLQAEVEAFEKFLNLIVRIVFMKCETLKRSVGVRSHPRN